MQKRVFDILEKKGEESMAVAEAVTRGKTIKEIAQKLNISLEDVGDALEKITNLSSFEYRGMVYWFKTKKSEPLLQKDLLKKKVERETETPTYSDNMVETSKLRGVSVMEDPTELAPSKPEVPLMVRVLETMDQPRTPTRIEQDLGVAYQDVHPVLRTLLASGYVERTKNKERCPGCGRKYPGRTYVMTESGRAVLVRLKA